MTYVMIMTNQVKFTCENLLENCCFIGHKFCSYAFKNINRVSHFTICMVTACIELDPQYISQNSFDMFLIETDKNVIKTMCSYNIYLLC